MLGHLSGRGYAPPAPPAAPRALRRVPALDDARPNEVLEPIAVRSSSAPAPAPSAAVAGDGRNVVSLEDRSRARRSRRPSVETNPSLVAPREAASAEEPRHVRSEPDDHVDACTFAPTNASAPPAEELRREPNEPNDRPLDVHHVAASTAPAEDALEVLPALASVSAPSRVEHDERRLDGPDEPDPDRALDVAPAPVDELAEVQAHEAQLDDPPAPVDDLPALSDAAAALLAAARALAALDPSEPIAAPVLVLEAHVGGMQLEDARAAVLELVQRGALVGEAGDDPSGLAPLDASGRTLVAVRLATALEA